MVTSAAEKRAEGDRQAYTPITIVTMPSQDSPLLFIHVIENIILCLSHLFKSRNVSKCKETKMEIVFLS